MTSAPEGPPGLDLTACDREPIHTPGAVQPHGALLALREPGLTVRAASANAAGLLGRPLAEILGAGLEAVFGAGQGPALAAGLRDAALDQNLLYLRNVTLGGDRAYQALAHRHDGVLFLELEPAPDIAISTWQALYPPVRDFVFRLQGVRGAGPLCALAAGEVRRVTGFDRVLVYRFDEDGHGTVVAEDRVDDDSVPPYLDLRFPASDIPRQARELYRLNRLRLIADAAAEPVPLVSDAGPGSDRPLDLTYAALRSVSPIHREYLRNMGVAASMSISVLRDGRLWGLIACHHRTPLPVPFETRVACDFLGHAFSLQLAAEEGRAEYENRIRLKAVQGKLLAFMAAEENFAQGLVGHPGELLEFASAGGAAVLSGGDCALVGVTPDEAAVRRLAGWLAGRSRPAAPAGDEPGPPGGPAEDVFRTDALPALLPEAEAYREHASGLLAVAISKLHRGYILWFRPEAVRTVRWAGDPRKPAENGDGRLHPRRSFELWKETVRGRSAAWRPSEVETAAELRNDVVGIVLRRAEELAALTAELTRSNQELESFSYSISHDLRAPFRHIVGYAELLRESIPEQAGPEARHYLQSILEAGRYAGSLVDNLLEFARLSRTPLHAIDVDLGELVREAQASLKPDVTAGRSLAWVIGPLPRVRGDALLLRQVFENLLSNAVKYTRPRAEARVEVSAAVTPDETVVTVGDNGVGFDMRYADKLFGVFQRLHRVEEFEGTGIGLANVARIVARHGGRVWAEGRVGAGAAFHFSLPRKEPE